MRCTFEVLAKRPAVFRALTTMDVHEFQVLVEQLQPAWEQRERERKERSNRKRRVGGQGHPYALSFPTMVLLLICSARLSVPNVVLQLLFGIAESTYYELLGKLLPLGASAGLPPTSLRKRSSRSSPVQTLDDLFQAYPGLEEVVIDGVEIPTERPKRQQRKSYTGKSKRHVRKAVLTVNRRDGIIVGKTALRPGAIHDKRLLAEDPLYRRLQRDADLRKRADSAWTGEDPRAGWIVNARGRRHHPLTDEERAENRRRSKVRIVVEHAIRRVKVFRRIALPTRFRIRERRSQVFDTAILLANYKQAIRHPVPA